MLRALVLVLAATVLVSCADELELSAPAAPQPAERELVPLSMALTLGDGDTRVGYTYDSEQKKLALSWSEKDQVGVYIKTKEGLILRAGALINNDTPVDNTCVFKGLVAQKFEGEEYIYMHPDLGMKTYIDFENQYGYINSTDHLNDYLPIVWKENGSGSYMGYVLKLNLTFNENPGSIRKVTLHTSRDVASGGSSNERVFPKQYNINSLGVDAPFTFTSVTPASAAPASTYTDAISLNIQGTGMPVDNGDGTFTAVAYLTNTAVTNLNVFDSKIRLEVLNHEGKTYTSSYESFKGQSSASDEILLSSTLLSNNGVHSMSRAVGSSGISPTIINYQYKVNSILGMWNEYGKPYDPNGLIYKSDGSAAKCPTIPLQLSDNEPAIKSRYKNAGTGPSHTPTFMLDVYNSQNSTYTDGMKQANAVCNNITITAPTEVYVTFLSEYAWNQNLLGYYHYEGEAPSSGNDVNKNIIYPNLSKPGHEPFNTNGQPKNNIGKNEDAPLKEYETVKLLYIDPKTGTASTTFPADTKIGFFMMIDVQANGFQQSQYSLLKWSQWRTFTNSAWNAENSRWSGAYNRCNFFASADVCNTSSTSASEASSSAISGLALYGMKDNATNDANTAYSTCLFMVSTSEPSAMQTQNKCYFNIGSGQLVINK